MNIEQFNGIDYIIISILSLSVLMGIIRGFVRESMSLVTWVAAIIVATLYCEPLSVYFTGISLVPVRLLISFTLLGLATFIVGGVIGHLISKLVNSTGFGFTDKLIGTLFGFGRGTIIVAIIVMALNPSPIGKASYWKASTLIPVVLPLSNWIQNHIPHNLKQYIPFGEHASEPEAEINTLLKNVPGSQS